MLRRRDLYSEIEISREKLSGIEISREKLSGVEISREKLSIGGFAVALATLGRD